jgi:K+ transporter
MPAQLARNNDKTKIKLMRLYVFIFFLIIDYMWLSSGQIRLKRGGWWMAV